MRGFGTCLPDKLGGVAHESVIVDDRKQSSFLCVPTCRQSTCWTCGCAALQSVLGFYGKEHREDELIEALGADYDNGTRHTRMEEFARKEGLHVVAKTKSIIDELERHVHGGNPCIVALQAWHADVVDTSFNYADEWEDGHYVVVIGVDQENVYLMDPSLLGCYSYLPRAQFQERWHDYENGPNNERIVLEQFGIFFSGLVRAFNPRAIQYMG